MTRLRRVWLTTSVATLASLPLVFTITANAADELTVSYMESGTYDKAAEELAERFGQEHGITVNVAAFPWAVLRQNNTTDLLTGAGQYQAMSGGYYLADVYANFAPLSELIERDKYGEGMIPGLMEPGRSEWFNGEQIGVPYGIDAYGLLVNNELLAAAGVAPDFSTWSDFIAACETVEAQTDAACFSHPTGNPEQIGAFFFSAYDGTYVNGDGAYELESEKATAAAAILPDLWAHMPPDSAALTFDEAHQVFMDGGVAMLVTWPSFVSNALDDGSQSGVAGKWSQVGFPGDGFPWLSLWQQFIPNNAEDKEIAWEWIKEFTGEDNAKHHYTKHNINSVWLSTYEDDALAAQHTHQWPAMIEGFSRAKNPPLSGEAQDFLTNTLVEVATGQVSAAEAIERVNQKWATVPVPSALLEAATGAGLRAQ